VINVCDAIMGAGKTSACIDMMNRNPHDKYIFITPYLEEAARIKRACPALHFMEPSSKLPEYKFTKTEHVNALIAEGRNIATTHRAFLFYTDETVDLVRERGYTLVIDENVDVLESAEANPDDVELLVRGGYLIENNGMYTWSGKEYNGTLAKGIMRIARSRDMVRAEQAGALRCEMFYWILPPKLIEAFKDVYILTYLFTGQTLCHFLEMYSMYYEYIGIEMVGDEYRFCEYPGYTPEYTYDLQNRVHILEDAKLNDIGNDYYALSMRWFKSNPDGVEQLKRNIYNFFRHKAEFIPPDQRMWGAHKKGKEQLKGKGYTKSFLTFNARAVNEYRHKTCLVYALNVFMNVGEKTFFQNAGIYVDDDMYALSTMIQWIWRSAIREGNDIYIYVPSSRMRSLLREWIRSVSSGGVQYGY